MRDAIVGLAGVSACADVTDPHLQRITTLDLAGHGISTLQAGDLAGLSGLGSLFVDDNSLTTLPVSVFDGLPGPRVLLLDRLAASGLIATAWTAPLLGLGAEVNILV